MGFCVYFAHEGVQIRIHTWISPWGAWAVLSPGAFGWQSHTATVGRKWTWTNELVHEGLSPRQGWRTEGLPNSQKGSPTDTRAPPQAQGLPRQPLSSGPSPPTSAPASRNAHAHPACPLGGAPSFASSSRCRAEASGPLPDQNPAPAALPLAGAARCRRSQGSPPAAGPRSSCAAAALGSAGPKMSTKNFRVSDGDWICPDKKWAGPAGRPGCGAGPARGSARQRGSAAPPALGRAGRVPLAGRAGGAALGVPQLRAPQPAPEWARPEERRVLIGCKFSFKYKGVFIKSRVGAFSSLQLLTALLLFLFLGVGMLTLLEEPAVTDAEEVSVWD